MTALIENAVTVAALAKTLKTTAAAVESDARELGLYVGHAWDGRPAISVTDAAAYVSGAARRDHDHAAAHGRWRADSEAWELQREAVRQQTYNEHFDAARRRGIGDPASAAEAAQVTSAAVESFEKSNPAPTFGDTESPRLSKRVKELLSK